MDNKVKIFGFVFARGGSKGILRKNIKPLAGKPLIHYAIESALQCRFLDRVIVSTDDEAIAVEGVRAGAQVPFMRPLELAEDKTPEWLAWQHAVQTLKEGGVDFDILVSVPATSPFRKPQDIDAAVSALLDDDTADAVITVTKASRHPSFNMVTLDNEGMAGIVMPMAESIARRQDAPVVYDITTVAYAVRADFILTSNSLFEGRVKSVIIPRERALDIDTEYDFKIAEFLIEDLRKN